MPNFKITKEVLSAIFVYVENVTEIIANTSPELALKIRKLLEHAEKLKKAISDEKSLEGIFRSIHTMYSLDRVVSKLYAMIDFKIDSGDDVSSSKAEMLSNMFDGTTKIYKLYMRDFKKLAGVSVDELFILAQPLFNAEKAQPLFHKYPWSIHLYVRLMTDALNSAYKERDFDAVNAITSQLELDKSHSLGEKKWTSPFLTMNLQPWTALPMTVAEVTKTAKLPATIKTLPQLISA